MKKITLVALCMMCSQAIVFAQPKPVVVSTKFIQDMEILTINGKLQYGRRAELATLDSSLPQSIDTALLLAKLVMKGTPYFTFFHRQLSTGLWVKIAQTEVIDNEIADTVALDTIASPITKGPVITFGRYQTWKNHTTRYYLEKYYLYFRKSEYEIR